MLRHGTKAGWTETANRIHNFGLGCGGNAEYSADTQQIFEPLPLRTVQLFSPTAQVMWTDAPYM